MSFNLGDGMPDNLPGEVLEAPPEGGEISPPAQDQLGLILTQLQMLSVAVYALIGNNPQYYTPDFDVTGATVKKPIYLRANTEIMRIDIAGTGQNYPSALTLTPVYVVFGESGVDVPPVMTSDNSVLASVINDNSTATARLYVGHQRPPEGQAYLSLDGYASETKIKVWLFIDGREKLFIPATEFTAI